MDTSSVKEIVGSICEYYKSIDKSTNIQQGFSRDKSSTSAVVSLFSENSVYERSGWPRPFVGKRAIENFFNTDRALVGQHHVVSWEIIDGFDEEIRNNFKMRFPDVDVRHCKTVVVKGNFTGAQCYPGDTSHLNVAVGLSLPYKDYWVIADNRVLYRYSDIEREQKMERY